MGLANGASDAQIKAAHRKKVIENHPDKFAQDSAEYAKAEERTKRINEARDVLLSRKWEPEYVRGPSGSPYANPFTNPYSSPFTYYTRGGQGNARPEQGFPFDSPFGEGWTWTSWGTGSAQGSEPFNPFDPFGPFRAQAQPQKTKEELKAEGKKNLRLEIIVLGIKLACAIGFAVAGSFPLGLFFYVLISFAFAAWKKLKGCLTPLAIPIIIVLALSPVTFLLAVRAAMLAFFLIIICLILLILDIRNMYRLIKNYRAL